MIRLENVSKCYPNGQEALSELNLHIPRGEMVFLTGHSGAGKSTLLNLINRTEVCDKGQVFVGGRNLNRMPRWRLPYLRRHMGIIFQAPQLLPQASVFDNVALPLIVKGVGYKELRRRTQAALDKVDLLDKARHLPGTLSGGEQQRVGIARAVVNRPPLLLADEPTGNLDPELSVAIMELLIEFNRVGVTVLVASHDLPLISRFGQRILVLKTGRLVSHVEPLYA